VVSTFCKFQIKLNSTDQTASNGAVGNDVESAAATTSKRAVDPNRPHTDEIVPVYRRDCQEEVGRKQKHYT
jgi:hypothetical protein